MYAEYLEGDSGSEDGEADKDDNVLINAPHPEYEIVSDRWEHSYTREKAAYPIESVRDNKFWVNVARVDTHWETVSYYQLVMALLNKGDLL